MFWKNFLASWENLLESCTQEVMVAGTTETNTNESHIGNSDLNQFFWMHNGDTFLEANSHGFDGFPWFGDRHNH